MTEESTLQDIVDKTQASKAGQLPALATESEGKGKHPNVPAECQSCREKAKMPLQCSCPPQNHH